MALHIDNDFLYDMGLHLRASLPSTISVGQEQRPGEVMAYTFKRAQNANLHWAIMTALKSFVCIIIAIRASSGKV